MQVREEKEKKVKKEKEEKNPKLWVVNCHGTHEEKSGKVKPIFLLSPLLKS